MATNHYFSQVVRSEQDLYENIIIESLKIYGQDVYYIPRDVVNEDRILGDDVPSRFNSSHRIEMYIQNIDGFDGEGDLFTRFGVEIRDQATFVVSRTRWTQTVRRHDNEIQTVRPMEGDLIYLPLSNKIFQIMHVEHEQPFYQLSNLPTYQLRCELFEYNDEQFDTGLPIVDNVELGGYTMELTLEDSADTNFVLGNTVTQVLSSGFTITGEIVNYNDSDNVLTVAHVGGDSGDLHLFTAGKISSMGDNGNNVYRTITSINEALGQANAQNDDFSSVDFLDFSESNPFGDPENN